MTHFLVATPSVHVTAAAADYLQGRLDPVEDSVTVVAVQRSDSQSRDAGDAINVARSRLSAVAPTTETRTGEPAAELLAAIDDHDPDEVVVATTDGNTDTESVVSTATELLARVNRPVVVVPLSPP